MIWLIVNFSLQESDHPYAIRDEAQVGISGLISKATLAERTICASGSSCREALQKPLLPSRMEQKCFVRFFLTTPEGAVFYQHNSKILL